jgi:hypothetical protein
MPIGQNLLLPHKNKVDEFLTIRGHLIAAPAANMATARW